jgi:hypothetical protein
MWLGAPKDLEYVGAPKYSSIAFDANAHCLLDKTPPNVLLLPAVIDICANTMVRCPLSSSRDISVPVR